MMFFYLSVTLAGLIIGSFLNLCIYRIPLGLSVVTGRSFCPACGEKIKWYHNIPILSYLCLMGHCRYCNTKISLRNPLVEALTGGCFLLLALTTPNLLVLFFHSWVMSALIVVAFIDLDTGEIPDRLHLLILLAGLISTLFPGFATLPDRMLGSVVISGFMWLVALFCQGFGGGDIKLMAASGFYLGTQSVVLAFFLATILAAFLAVALMIKEKKALSGQIPFGPYLSAGIFITLTFGSLLINWYLGRLF